MKQILILTLTAICLSSCFQQFYKTNTNSKVEAAAIEQLQTQNKVFFVHTPDEAFILKNTKLDKDSLTGDREPLDPKYEKYMNPAANEANRYPKREKDIALSEVHMYTNSSFDGMKRINLATNQIFRMDVYDKDMKAIKKSRAISIVGLIIPPVIIVAVGVAAFSYAESQPYNFNINWH